MEGQAPLRLTQEVTQEENSMVSPKSSVSPRGLASAVCLWMSAAAPASILR